jgi:hypothetical protein
MAKRKVTFTQEEHERAQSYDRLFARGTEWIMNFLVIALVVGVALLLIEFFIVNPASNNPERSALITLLCLYPLFTLSCLLLGFVWFRARRHFRETYALGASIALVLGGLIFIVTIYSWLVPWEMSAPIVALIANRDISQPVFSPVNFLLLLLLYGWCFIILRNLHARWPGRRSRIQVLRDMGSNRPSLFGEAVFELERRIRREPALEEYIEPHQQFHLDLPTEPIESLAWVDQARDLLCLASASYSFRPRVTSLNLEELDEQSSGEAGQLAPAQSDAESDWHDLQNIWIGRNDRSKKAVALVPVQNAIDQGRLAEQIAYVRRTAQQRSQALEEVIIAVREGQAPPAISARQNIPLRVETEHTLLEQTINLDDYRSIIEKRVRRLQPNTNLTLNDIYTPMRGKVPEQANPVDVEAYIGDWLAESGRRHLALLGSYGQGKSTVALMLTYHLLMAHPGLPPRIPILIELRGRNLRNLNPYALLGQWAGRYGMNGRALVQLHDAGRLLLIFEGFDEMAYLADMEMRISYFRALWEFARYPNAKILISGRPNLFESQGELEQALNLRKAFGAGAYCEPIYLERLLLPEIKDTLRSHPAHVRDAVYKLAGENKSFYDIVSRPSLLQLVAAIWDEPEMKAIATAPTSADVMRAFVHSTHRRQTEKEEHAGEFMKLTEVERVYFMGGVALYMAAKGETTITARRLAELTDQLRIEMPDTISEEVSVLADRQPPLRVRIKNQRGEDDPALVERVKTEVRTSSLLESEPDVPGILKFGHKSFLEYIFAEEISRVIQKPHAPRSRVLLRVSEAQIISILDQPESVDFLAELLASQVGETKLAANQLSIASDTVQLEIGRQLLQAIIQKPKWTLFPPPPPPYTLLFSVFLSFPSIFLLNSLFLLLLSVILALSLPIPGIQAIPLPSLLLSLISLVFSLLYLIIYFSIKNTDKLRLWFRICKKLDLRDHVFYAETGTSIIFRLRGKPFPFFRQPRSKGNSIDKPST